MAQLASLDSGLFKAQDHPHPHSTLAIGAVAVFNGAAPDYGLLETRLAALVNKIPRCTQVLRSEWADYPAYDLTEHVSRVALPRPGDETELFLAVTRALERPLDPDRPPWECSIIEGLKGGQWAILLKIHPALANGISAAHVLARLCDDSNADTFANRLAVKQVSTQASAGSWAETLWRTSTTATGAVCKAAARAVTWPATWIAPTRAITTMRRYRTVRVPRADVDSVCAKFGVTPDAVALTAITEGFRSVLLHRGEQPRADSLRTLETAGPGSAVPPFLPVEQHDPVQQLCTVHNQLNPTTPSARPHAAGWFDLAASTTPFTLCTKIVQALAGTQRQDTVAVTTSTPGLPHPLRLMGQPVHRLLPIPPTTPELSSGVSVLSFGDELVFGILVDYGAASEMTQLISGIELGMARLVALSRDSVLLFTRHRRRRLAGAIPRVARQGRTSAPTARVRH